MAKSKLVMPESLRILGRAFSIKKDNSSFLGHTDSGEMSLHKQRIVVSMDQQPMELGDTLLHETIHAIDELLDTELSERQVHTLATGLMQIAADNPTFLPWLQQQALTPNRDL